jgi:exodeoxyribonuclease V alpha subunit
MQERQEKIYEFRRVRIDSIFAQKERWKSFAFTVLEGNHQFKHRTFRGHGEVDIDTGSYFELMTIREIHPKFGEQFRVVAANLAMPTERVGVVKFLRRHFSDIGVKRANQLVDVFGTDLMTAFTNLDEVREKISTVLRWSNQKTELFISEWSAKKPPVRAELILLACHVTARQIESIKRVYSLPELNVIIEQNPYQLMGVAGVGFKTVDKIARTQGFDREHPVRIWAGIAETLRHESSQKGNCWTGYNQVIADSSKLLEISIQKIRNQVEANPCPIANLIVVDEAGDWWHRSIYTAERKIAERISTIQSSPNNLAYHVSRSVLETIAGEFREEKAINLTDEQKDALYEFLQEKVTVLTGGPGTGKTTILKAFLRLLRYLGVDDYYLCAPTGKAAKRISETCETEAFTIHRLLGLGRGIEAEYSSSNPLPAKVIIVDETSMVDCILMARLLDAVKDSCHVILIGDADQLPSVGAGKVLRDLVDCGQISTIRLNQVHRQAQESLITMSAHRINRGMSPLFSDDKDMWLREAKTPAEAQKFLVELLGRQLPLLGFDQSDIRVLTPFNQGVGGVDDLNKVIQQLVNPAHPDKNQVLWRGLFLREGDRLIWTQNNYELELMNGEDCVVTGIRPSGGDSLISLKVERGIETRLIDVPLSLITAKHGFAGTIHKCLPASEKVWTKNKGLIGIDQVKAGDEVLTGEKEYKKVLNTFISENKQPFTVKTNMGYKLRASGEHPVLVFSNNRHTFKNVEDLQVGDTVCLMREALEVENRNILPEIEFNQIQHKQELHSNLRGKINLPQRLNETLAYLLGILVGDGCYSGRRDGMIEITNMDDEVLTSFENILNGFGIRTKRRSNTPGRAVKVYAFCKPFRDWLANIGLDYVTARQKAVPDCIFQSDGISKAAFLRGLFDTDGSRQTANAKVSLTSFSLKLLQGCQELLLSLGIVAYISSNSNDSYHLSINNTSIKLFRERIGFSVSGKKSNLDLIIEKQGFLKNNEDSIPVIGNFGQVVKMKLDAAGKPTSSDENLSKVRMPPPDVSSERYKVSHAAAHRLDELFSANKIASPSGLREIVERGYFYDSIAEIKKETVLETMYDLEIEDIHSFISGGFICHNSQGSEYKCAIVMAMENRLHFYGRRLLYTAVTRAKQLCVVVGTRAALAQIVAKDREDARRTKLAERFFSFNQLITETNFRI